MLDIRSVDHHVPFLIRLRLNRVTPSCRPGATLVLEMLRVFARVARALVVSAVVRLSPRALLPAVGSLTR